MTYRRVKDPKRIVVRFKTPLRDGADVAACERTSRRTDNGEEIDLVRFESKGALTAWREQPEHRDAQRRGQDEFSDRYSIQSCRVLREYEFSTGDIEAMAQTSVAQAGAPERRKP